MSGFSRVEKFVQVLAETESLRDARGLRDRGVDIVVGEDAGTSAPLMVSTAAALALRCVDGPVRIHLPAGVQRGGLAHATAVVEAAEEVASAYDAADRLDVGGVQNSTQLEVGIAKSVERGAWASARGWKALINEKSRGGDSTAPAAVFATCCAVAKTFAAGVLGRAQHLHESWVFDLADISGTHDVPAQLDLGRLALLGAGAIGNGVAYVLAASGWSAQLTVIDSEEYEEPNHETSVLLSPTVARRGPKKARALADLVRSSRVSAAGVVERVGASSPVLNASFETFMCAVDNRETRQLLDQIGARCLLNAGVGGGLEDGGILVWSRHESGDPALSARYSRGAPSVAPLPMARPPHDLDACSRVAYEDVSLAAPFMGLAAGALLVAGCVPSSLGPRPGAVRHLTFDLLKLQGAYQARHRP